MYIYLFIYIYICISKLGLKILVRYVNSHKKSVLATELPSLSYFIYFIFISFLCTILAKHHSKPYHKKDKLKFCLSL